jgi:hypothetical protein
MLKRLRPQRYGKGGYSEEPGDQSEAAAPPAEGAAEVVKAQDLKKVSSYLLYRCNLQDINVFVKELQAHLQSGSVPEQGVSESQLQEICPEKNRKTILLILKQLDLLDISEAQGAIQYHFKF